jgi:septal ring factor EnvC (AmiA/AmiB activator)
MDSDGVTTSEAEGVRPDLAEMAELADALVEEVAAARSQYEELRAVLDEAAAEQAEPEREEATAREPEAAADEAPGGDTEEWEPPLPERARLGALSMALTGGSRDQTRGHLHHTFGIEDPEPILDEVFGNFPDPDPEPVTAPKKRFAWLRRGR